MMRLALLACLLAGCGLYWNDGGGGQDGGMCYEAPPSNVQLRDPVSGQCETVTTGGCGACTPCGLPVSNTYPADWAPCDSQCRGLAETTCLATPACQAEYLSNGTTSSFWGCYAVAPSGPIEGSCTGLDAYACSRHDDCTANYGPVGDGDPTGFVKCVAEGPPPPPPPACDTLTTESACTARTDCDAVYDGFDCTCDPSGCTCKTETFAKCQAR
jgi:hypothetical protein